MFISCNWLNDFTNIPSSIEPLYLKEKLTTSTAEVEKVTIVGQDGIVIGKVLQLEKHPNADKLTLVTVSLGKEEWKVVCGGTNLSVGMLIAFAQEGAKVKWHGKGDYIPLEKATIRGVESRGMICASNEIDLPVPCEEKEIADLTDHVQMSDVGKNVYDVLGIRDAILEVDNKSLTHRPDLFGHYGFAREVFAMLKNQDDLALKLKPYPQKKLIYGKVVLPIEIQSEQCRRYSALKVEGVQIGPSPSWLQQRLIAVGIRPINNVVDITNYILYDLGQPLHAFDATALKNDTIIIRQAREGERIIALDGKEYSLQDSDLVIADKTKPVAVAGVMGGEHFGVQEKTSTIIFESANFDPVSIRKTSLRLGLRSESSARFEKNLDPEYTLLALNRAVTLIQEMCPSATIASQLFDAYPVKIPLKAVPLKPERVIRKIGLKIAPAMMKNILKDLGCTLTTKTTKEWSVTPPSWRATKDVLSEDDLIEEIARIYGYDKIPHTAPIGVLHATTNHDREFERAVRTIMVHRLGFFETMNYPFTNLVKQKKFHLDTDNLLALNNTLSSQQTHLRTSPIPDLLENAKYNIHQFDEFALMEFGRIYTDNGEPREKNIVAGIMVTKPTEKMESVFYTLKTKLETLYTLLHFQPRTYKPLSLPYLETGSSASIHIGKIPLGFFGIPKNEYLDEYDLAHHQTAIFVLYMEALLQAQEKSISYLTIPKYPPVTRDFAVLVDKAVSSEAIEQAICSCDPLINQVELFDHYEGDTIGPHKRSLAFSVTFLSPDATLTEQDIAQVETHIFDALKKTGATLRI